MFSFVKLSIDCVGFLPERNEGLTSLLIRILTPSRRPIRGQERPSFASESKGLESNEPCPEEMNVPLTDEMIRIQLGASFDDGAATHVKPPGDDSDSTPLQRGHITNLDKTTTLNPNTTLETPHRSYPSSPRVSRMSMASAFSQFSSFSQDSSSSWRSAGTSFNDRPITPATTVSFSHTQHTSSKHDSIDLSSFMNYTRPLSFDASFSPYAPPSGALPPIPSSPSDTRPDSPVHSLSSEYSDTFGGNSPSSPPAKEQLRVFTQQSHHESPPPKPPPRPPRNPNRPSSPEVSVNTKTTPNPPAVSRGPGPGVPPHWRSHNQSQSYTASSPSSSSSSSSSSSPQPHVHFSHFYPLHTNLSHVTEEEEGQSFQSGSGSGSGSRRGLDDHRFSDVDVYSIDFTDIDEHEREFGHLNVDWDNHVDDEGNPNRNFYLAPDGGGGGGGPRRSVWSPYTSFLPSIYSAVSSDGGNSSPSRSPTALKNKWIESATLSQRARSHLNRLKKWKKRAVTTVIEGSSSKRGKEGAQIGSIERDMVVKMISDGLEMARSCYSVGVHKLGYELGKEVQQWLQTFMDNDPTILAKKENITLFTSVQTCFLPVLLMRIAQIEPTAGILANNLIIALTKVPLSLHEDETHASPLFTSLPSNNRSPVDMPPSSPRNSFNPVIPQRTTSVSSIAIHMVSQELGSPTPICSSQHPWLGMTLLKTVEMTVKLRLLSFGEIEDITMVGRKREGEYTTKSDIEPSSPLIDASITRPWEVALFALCASTETPAAPFFKRMVLGSMGIPLLIRSLDSLLALTIDMGDVKWEDVGLTIRALAFVSKHGWVVQGLNGDRDGEGEGGGGGGGEVEELVESIMKVFWRSIPERWFSIRFWAMDTVRNIVSHQPTLVRLLSDIKADKAFITLTPSSPLYPPRINTTRTNASGKSPNKLHEEYKKESAKRAGEMVEYIRTLTGCGDGGGGGDSGNGTNCDDRSKSAVVLKPVAIGFDGE